MSIFLFLHFVKKFRLYLNYYFECYIAFIAQKDSLKCYKKEKKSLTFDH